MGVFLLPLSLCQDLEKAMCKFWWRTDSKKDKGIHWLSWNNMSKRKAIGGMGFRSLHDFNIALLGKQGWRLLQHLDKLVSKVFKARYYPSGSFLSASLGSSPSYIWRSVLVSQPLIRQGIGCCVGDGVSINILTDPWLPLQQDPYVHYENQALQGQKVSALMNSDHQWDVDLIEDIFNYRDAAIILNIPLNYGVGDSWYWRKEKLGNFSVKSAYHLLQEGKYDQATNSNSGFWRKLWNLKIPPKVKNFLWRASTNTLPTKDLLRSRRVAVNALCPTCNEHEETILHTLVTCSYARSCWSEASIHLPVRDFQIFSHWLQSVFQQYDKAQSSIISMICWMIWKHRNNLVWNQTSIEFTEVVRSAYSILNQWRGVQDKTFNHLMSFTIQGDGAERWSKPQVDSIKINTDAAIFEELHRFSYAIVIRDHSGSLIEASSKCRNGQVNPDLAEAFGIKEALSWIISNRYSNVIVETDCLQLVQARRSSTPCYSYLGQLIQECRDMLASLISKNICFRFVKRSANRVARHLTRYNCSLADRVWRMGDVHSDFYNVLLDDLY